MTNFSIPLPKSYDQAFMSAPTTRISLKILLYLWEMPFLHFYSCELHKETLSPPLYALIVLAIWMITTPLMENSAFKGWLYYLG